jgi:hypothetical protein
MALEIVEYFIYVGRMITNDARCAREIIFKISMTKAILNKKNIPPPYQKIGLKIKEKTSAVLHLEHSFLW